jgi:hypothetical protein
MLILHKCCHQQQYISWKFSQPEPKLESYLQCV